MSLKILVIDDDQRSIDKIKDIIHTSGMTRDIYEARSGPAGLQILTQQATGDDPIDLVILDKYFEPDTGLNNDDFFKNEKGERFGPNEYVPDEFESGQGLIILDVIRRHLDPVISNVRVVFCTNYATEGHVAMQKGATDHLEKPHVGETLVPLLEQILRPPVSLAQTIEETCGSLGITISGEIGDALIRDARTYKRRGKQFIEEVFGKGKSFVPRGSRILTFGHYWKASEETKALFEPEELLPSQYEAFLAEKIGNTYEIESFLRDDSLGMYFSAKDAKDNRPVTLFLLHPDNTISSENLNWDEQLEIQGEILSKVRQTGALISTKRLAKVALEEEDFYLGRDYLLCCVMDSLEGYLPLREYFRRGMDIKPLKLAPIFDQIISSLGAIHGLGHVHGLITEETIFLPETLMKVDTPCRIAGIGLVTFLERKLAPIGQGLSPEDCDLLAARTLQYRLLTNDETKQFGTGDECEAAIREAVEMAENGPHQGRI